GAWSVMDEAHITTIGVHPDHRRHGIGERLFATLLEEAAERGVRRASLEVRESNRAAQSLYAKYGFVPIARRRRYYSDTGEDAIVMWVEDLQAVGHGRWIVGSETTDAGEPAAGHWQLATGH